MFAMMSDSGAKIASNDGPSTPRKYTQQTILDFEPTEIVDEWKEGTWPENPVNGRMPENALNEHTRMAGKESQHQNGLISNESVTHRSASPSSMKSDSSTADHHPGTLISTFLNGLPQRVNLAAGQAAWILNRLLSSKQNDGHSPNGTPQTLRNGQCKVGEQYKADGQYKVNGQCKVDAVMNQAVPQENEDGLVRGTSLGSTETTPDDLDDADDPFQLAHRPLMRTLTCHHPSRDYNGAYIPNGFKRIESVRHGSASKYHRSLFNGMQPYLRSLPTPSLPSSPTVGNRSPALSRPTRHVSKVDSITLDTGYVKLNQYKLMSQIGQGSYGIVKLAYNEEDNSHYAMKILDKKKLMKKLAFFRKPPVRNGKNIPSYASDPLAQVHREIAILKKLNHPNVVKLVEVLDDPCDNYLYMVFEFLEKGCVMDIPTNEPLDEQTAWRYFRDALLGLEYLHYQKIVHRDLKPSNLLVSETGRIKIADFGVSSEFEGIDAFLTGTAGTPAFMAPEALQEGANQFYSGRAQDIWSLGITLYAFVFGCVPFWDHYVIALHKKIKTEPLVFPESPSISASLRSLITSMLNKDPARRLTLSEIRHHDWVTKLGQTLLPSEEENCQNLITVTEEDIQNSVRVIPSLGTLILIKSMGQRRRFGNPFRANGQNEDHKDLIGARKSAEGRILNTVVDRWPSNNDLPCLNVYNPPCDMGIKHGNRLSSLQHNLAVRCASANPALMSNSGNNHAATNINGWKRSPTLHEGRKHE